MVVALAFLLWRGRCIFSSFSFFLLLFGGVVFLLLLCVKLLFPMSSFCVVLLGFLLLLVIALASLWFSRVLAALQKSKGRQDSRTFFKYISKGKKEQNEKKRTKQNKKTSENENT